jgi:ABC transport permease subunit
VAGPLGARAHRRGCGCSPRFDRRGVRLLRPIGVAFPKAIAAPRSVDWRSLPRLLQEIGADALLVTSAANLLIGVIIGFLGVSQLGRFGAVAFVPELVVVAHFRELGPLVTAIVVAGRSGAGLASELATMQVSEEIDALRAMGFDPVRWLVVPRCLALAIVLPLLTWIGDGLALVGGLAATTVITHMTPRAYVLATADTITVGHLLAGLVKSPFPRPGDRPHRLRSRACRAGRRRRGRRADDERGRPGHLRHDRDQLALHALLRVPRHMTAPHTRPHIIVDDLRIGWGSRVLMEHVSFDIARDRRSRSSVARGAARAACSATSSGLAVRRLDGSTSMASVNRTSTKGRRRSACSSSPARSSARSHSRRTWRCR